MATRKGSVHFPVGFIRILLRDGRASPSIKNSHDDAPLHWAAVNGDLSVAKLLLEFGAQLDAPNRYRNSPLHLAVENRHVAVAALFLDAGACGVPLCLCLCACRLALLRCSPKRSAHNTPPLPLLPFATRRCRRARRGEEYPRRRAAALGCGEWRRGYGQAPSEALRGASESGEPRGRREQRSSWVRTAGPDYRYILCASSHSWTRSPSHLGRAQCVGGGEQLEQEEERRREKGESCGGQGSGQGGSQGGERGGSPRRRGS